jgi:hypothetical protein
MYPLKIYMEEAWVGDAYNGVDLFFPVTAISTTVTNAEVNE